MFILLGVLIPLFAYAFICNLYVSPDGSGSECSVTNPCQIQTALDTAKTNGRDDVLCLKRGIYSIDTPLRYDNDEAVPENFSITLLGETDISGNPITVLRSTSSEKILKIDLCLLSGDNCLIDVRGDVYLKNIRFEGATAERALEVYLNRSGLILENVIFENNNTPTKDGTVFIYSQNGDISIKYSSFLNNVSRKGAVYIKNINGTTALENITLSLNTSTGNGGGGNIFTKNGEMYAVNSLILQNRGNLCGGFLVETVNGNVTFTNNDILGNISSSNYGGLCIYADNDSPTVNIYNNIFWGNYSTGYGQDLYINNDNDANLTGCDVEVRNNFGSCDFDLGFPSTCFDIERASLVVYSENVTDTSPGFVSYPADLHLNADSICINSGKTSAPHLPDKDRDGNRRVYGSSVDIGMYEYGSSPDAYTVEVIIEGEGTVYSSPSFINCGTVCRADIPSSYSFVSLTARAYSGYIFDHWEGSCSICGKMLTCTINLDSNKICRAYFVPVSGGGGGCTFFVSYSVASSLSNLIFLILIPASIFLKRFLFKGY